MCLAISPYLSDVNSLFIKYILAIMAILRYTLFTILRPLVSLLGYSLLSLLHIVLASSAAADYAADLAIV